MSLSSNQIESMVRRVLAEMTSDNPPIDPQELELREKLITLETLKNRIVGVKRVLVRRKAIVTPAASDLLREKKVELVRFEGAAKASSVAQGKSSLRMIAIGGQANYLSGLKRQVCPRQADWLGDNLEPSALENKILEELKLGRSGCVGLTPNPELLACQVNRHGDARAVVLYSWNQSMSTLTRFPANVLLLDADSWNIASAANLVRWYYRHLTKNH